MAKQAVMDSSTIGRSLFRKKLKPKSMVEDDLTSSSSRPTEFMLPGYERVVLKKPAFKRPVVFFGPLADVARQLLLSNFGPFFGTTEDETSVKISSINKVIEADKHCVLNINPCSVERLQQAQYAPIVILVDVDSRNRIRELRSKAGATTTSARRLLEQTNKIKKHYGHLLTATLDAIKEDGWFDALRMLVAHLQERRVWVPETANVTVNEIVLHPLSTHSDTEDSSRCDYGVVEGGKQSRFSSANSTPSHAQKFVVVGGDKRLSNGEDPYDTQEVS